MVTIHVTLSGRPDNLDGDHDCTVRALTNFLDVPYAEVQELLKAHTDYTPKKGCRVDHFADLMESLGFTYVKKAVRINSKTAADKLPSKGILHFKTHVAAYIDGEIYDMGAINRVPGLKQTIGFWI